MSDGDRIVGDASSQAQSDDSVQRAVPRSRFVGWVALVAALAALSYAATAAGGETPDDVLYRWETAVGGTVQYAIVLAIVLALCRGIDPALLGLRRPRSWPRALGLVALGYVTIAVLAGALNTVLEAGEEQGLVPEEWDPERAAPFVANFLVVTIAAPVVEELTYRGLGFAVTRARFGLFPTVGITSLAFGLAHGLVVALTILTLFGVVLAVLRARTDSLYPPIILHAIFNGVALVLAVTLDVG
jgi:membrane protease YdiL (CAAX protease family)